MLHEKKEKREGKAMQRWKKLCAIKKIDYVRANVADMALFVAFCWNEIEIKTELNIFFSQLTDWMVNIF